jgi:hypothetical protein
MLPLFDPNSPCKKCGATNAVTQHASRCSDDVPERMMRLCRTCGFRWDERPLDQRTEAELAEEARWAPIPVRWHTSGD